MIRTFGVRATQDIWDGENTAAARAFPREVWNTAQRKLDMIHAARNLIDLRVPPGNRLERLKGKMKDFCSIRINDQFRIIFKWTQGAADEVEIIDYH
ncbi:MAG: type II toxin-antitoxin system RelE/ParE family toxin [Elusimicrobia bacterium]|nr:type II toxin-antitoxin system RelE/ParE family toxin [Elusimicrobiota bacterium]